MRLALIEHGEEIEVYTLDRKERQEVVLLIVALLLELAETKYSSEEEVGQ